ncbi:MAG: NADH-quinone oxidoreductase subunit J [Firmicutes bacterium]|nr:NADH-quinone oxidoreductase subunit J [Bacillota bacterium]
MKFLDDLVLAMPTLGFITLGVVILVAAWMVGRVRRITHAAFFMVLAFTGVAGVFILLGADFLGVTQVLVYVGAIAVMFLFAIMVSDLKELSDHPAGRLPEAAGAPPGSGAERSPARVAWVVLAGLVALGFAGLVLAALWRAGLPSVAVPAASGPPTTAPLGKALFTTFLVPFEVASVVLLAALVGAVVIAAQEESGKGAGS